MVAYMVVMGVAVGNKSWKQRERDVGELIGGKRYPANQGGLVDVESKDFVVQVKERKALSLAELTKLVEEIEGIAQAKGKAGLVAVKVRKGRGNPTPLLIVQSATQWRRLAGETFDFPNGAVTDRLCEPE
jgi:hypothetical protein